MQFSYDIPFQRAVLRLCMIDDVFNARAMEHLSASYFTTQAHGWIFGALKQYNDDYRMRCTDMPLRNFAAQAQNTAYVQEVEIVISLGLVPEADYVKAELREFIRRAAFALAHKETQLLYNGGKHNQSYDVMRDAMDKINTIDFDEVDRTWFFEDVRQRTRANYHKGIDPTEDTFTTGWPEFDRYVNGGIHIGEVFLLLGKAKRGKSTFLVNQVFHGVRLSRQPVLVINLEGSTQLWSNRLDACFTGELYDNVRKGDITPEIWRAMLAEYESNRKMCVIRTLGDWSPNILHIEAELIELKAQNFKPKIIVLDYVDLLRSRYEAKSETDHQVASMKDTKLLANKGYAIWSACQGQRPKTSDETKPTILRAANIADAYGKVRIADGWGSLNATDEEKRLGKSRLFWEEYRDGQVGKLFAMDHDLKSMRMGTTFNEYQAPNPQAQP
jgi:replicative DNA helicase